MERPAQIAERRLRCDRVNNRSAELHTKGAGHDQGYPIRGSGCAQGDDRGGRGRAGWFGFGSWGDSESAGDGAAACQEAGSGWEVAGVLRGWAMRICLVLAVDGAQRGLRRGGAESDPSGVRGSGQDGPEGREEAGSDVPRRVVDGGVGAGRGSRGVERPCASPGGGQEGRASGATSVGEVSAAAWVSGTGGSEGMDEAAYRVAGESAFRASGSGGGVG